MSLSVVAFVPMRHSSERVAGKNYRDFNGKPLFHHIVSTLAEVPYVQRIVIDTDSATITEQCADLFPEVACIPRPEHLLGGEVSMTKVLEHDASLFDSEWYLQTHSTNPLLRASTISSGIERLASSIDDHDSLFGVTRLQTRLYDAAGEPLNHDPTELLRTQDLPPVFEENSNIYLFSRELISAGRRIGDRPILFEVDAREAVDIDVEHDFLVAELLAAPGNRP